MEITGKNLIGNQLSAKGSSTFKAINPQNGTELPVLFHEADANEIGEAIALADRAHESYRKLSKDQRAAFLEEIAERLTQMKETIISRCMQETGLPDPRLQGELGRTTNQLKLFASVVREGSWVDARIDTAIPDRQPIPKPDLRHMQLPLGPVGVFGASNFPLAFSVAGGDTASALAAGCTVVFKGHPAHPGTSELVAAAIIDAAKHTGMPEGVFSLVQGRSNDVGGAIVKHAAIKAIGFTGSYAGGKALFDIANQREVPIPVYAEMGSLNPVFILPDALKTKGEEIAGGLFNSLTLGWGQFCTNPGLSFVTKSPESDRFIETLSGKIKASEAAPMLTSQIGAAYEKATSALAADAKVENFAAGSNGSGSHGVVAKMFRTDVEGFMATPEASEEIFGPSGVIVEAGSKEEILKAADQLDGHLTATVFGTEKDIEAFPELFTILEQKAGRVIVNGYPTGVEVSHAMVHGGPFPSTTAPQTTSVGTNAIKRFARPVCYQDFPQSLLPEELKDGNELEIWRMVNGQMTKDPL
ncbi:aldehyde dehydrogenase (NADP(+)) [Fulvivirgaceae bacterium BMA12]|uniref:Aldehyde dehydrogenase (NADP(+)) n=1 Tax=Agaribacillus aureus TaxID=3051825 RepID=A0ABT8KYA8_9BACT|nr:aldehyde dehydrogenase (NADP(+)) [Fulvivirgaceae bacterium BMA12]